MPWQPVDNPNEWSLVDYPEDDEAIRSGLHHMGIDSGTIDMVLGGVNAIDHHKTAKRWDSDACKALEALKAYGSDVSHHVTEVYSPPRVASMASKLGMIPGMSFDLTRVDPDDGKPWDFNDPGKRNKAKRHLRFNKPLLLIGSPMCAAFSQLQRLNFSKMSPEDVRQVVEHGKGIWSSVWSCMRCNSVTACIFSMSIRQLPAVGS